MLHDALGAFFAPLVDQLRVLFQLLAILFTDWFPYSVIIPFILWLVTRFGGSGDAG